jgi:hypothetical protein
MCTSRPRALSRIRKVIVTGALISVLGCLAAIAPPASASIGQNPQHCGKPKTWKSRTFHIHGDEVRVELRTPARTFTETVGGLTHTWTNYSDAGGT